MFIRKDVDERFHWNKEEHPEIKWSNTEKLLWLYWFIASTYPKKDKVIVELGTNEGTCSTVAWTAAINETGGVLYTIDIEDRGQRERLSEESNVIIIIENDLSVGEKWDKPIDILYIDDGHEEGHVFKEVELFAPKIVSGGLILFHDTCPGYGPYNAFNELIKLSEWESVLKIPHIFSDGLYGARRK